MKQNAQYAAENPLRLFTHSRFALGFWLLVFISMPICVIFADNSWDVAIYQKAIQSLHIGHDPYADAIAVQQVYHLQHPGDLRNVPYSYVYSPITLPLLSFIAKLPVLFSGVIYWTIYILAVLAQVWFAVQATDSNERRLFACIAPLAPFFPGFLGNGAVFSGNIAYILYALMLCGALYAWRTHRWAWFYAAVLLASCVKAPLLSLVVIPVLTTRKQWLQAGLTAIAGIAFFAVQPLLWPDLFKNYLKAVELQFSYNRDFGCGPAGLFSDLLENFGIPYSPGSLIFYVCYAIPLFALLLLFSRKYLRGEFTLHQWTPVMLVGVILLNPRVMEYDVAPLSLLMALIAWRFLASLTTSRNASIGLAILFAATNAVAATSWYTRKLVDCPLLVLTFAAGCWTLLQPKTAALDGNPALPTT